MYNKKQSDPESVVREIKRRTRRKLNAEEKIRIILDGLKGEKAVTELCRKEGIHPTQFYKWSKAFLEAGKKQLDGDTHREANTNEVNQLRNENDNLKQLVAEVSLKNRVLKKTLKGLG